MELLKGSPRFPQSDIASSAGPALKWTEKIVQEYAQHGVRRYQSLPRSQVETAQYSIWHMRGSQFMSLNKW